MAILSTYTVVTPQAGDLVPLTAGGGTPATRNATIETVRNFVGTVAGNPPTGAAMQTGSGATGRWYRFAHGWQVCEHALTLDYVNTTILNGTWVFPAAFIAAPTSFAAILTSASVQTVTFGVQQIGVTLRGTATTTQVVFSTFLASGASADPADTLTLNVMASGRCIA